MGKMLVLTNYHIGNILGNDVWAEYRQVDSQFVVIMVAGQRSINSLLSTGTGNSRGKVKDLSGLITAGHVVASCNSRDKSIPRGLLVLIITVIQSVRSVNRGPLPVKIFEVLGIFISGMLRHVFEMRMRLQVHCVPNICNRCFVPILDNRSRF